MNQFSRSDDYAGVEQGYLVHPINYDTTIVSVGDHLDFRNSPGFKEMLSNQFDRGTRNFILDFSMTRSFDSTGIGSLFSLYRKLSQERGIICFASASEVVLKTVEITRSYKVFPQFNSVEEAQKAVNKRRFR